MVPPPPPESARSATTPPGHSGPGGCCVWGVSRQATTGVRGVDGGSRDRSCGCLNEDPIQRRRGNLGVASPRRRRAVPGLSWGMIMRVRSVSILAALIVGVAVPGVAQANRRWRTTTTTTWMWAVTMTTVSPSTSRAPTPATSWCEKSKAQPGVPCARQLPVPERADLPGDRGVYGRARPRAIPGSHREPRRGQHLGIHRRTSVSRSRSRTARATSCCVISGRVTLRCALRHAWRWPTGRRTPGGRGHQRVRSASRN